VARVDGDAVTRADVDAVRAERRLAGEDDAEAAARDEAVRRLLVRREAAGLGVSVPEADVEKRLQAIEERLGGAEGLTAALEAAQTSKDQLTEVARYSLLETALQDRMFADLTVSAAEVRRFYADERNELFTRPARIRLRAITLPSERLAETLAAEIREGASFSDVARRASIDRETRESGGDLSWVTVASLPEVVRGAVAEVPAGGLAEPVKFLGRWQLYMVQARRAASVTPLAEVDDAIRAELTRRRRAAALETWAAEERERSVIEYAE
jgi:parvulin-like peptidyl-prolyl isomerase